MKSAASIKSKTDSPKTPGGISKALLTPCRRVGLSRNWKKSTISPFNSPLTGAEIKQDVEKEEKKSRKRKDEIVNEIDITPQNVEVSTPIRNVELPRRKKSKTLLSSLNDTSENQDNIKSEQTKEEQIDRSPNVTIIEQNIDKNESTKSNVDKEPVSTPVALKSKSKGKIKSPGEKNIINDASDCKIENKINIEDKDKRSEVKSPNNLTKECIVVIQKKIFKEEINKEQIKDKQPNKTSQTLFDSDSDDIPLCQINKEVNKPVESNDDDFTTKKTVKIPEKPKKEPPISKPKKSNTKTQSNLQITTQNSQNSDEDDDFVEKRTIVIKKTYNKTTKPVKAKSTGSITQKDIDELKTRIEKKKKMLLAKAITEDTKELRDLIKKWQKGCQDALMELMNLMKNKMPDNKNMDYSEMLKALKIPAGLVGYDSENDYFCTPNDEGIILANLGD